MTLEQIFNWVLLSASGLFTFLLKNMFARITELEKNVVYKEDLRAEFSELKQVFQKVADRFERYIDKTDDRFEKIYLILSSKQDKE
jgi:hypothetical protein